MSQETMQSAAPRILPLDEIRPSKTNPRTIIDKDALAELTESVRKHGILQPVLVRPVNGKVGGFELVAGCKLFGVSLKALDAKSKAAAKGKKARG